MGGSFHGRGRAAKGAASIRAKARAGANPVLAVVTRAGIVESAHRGAFVAVDASGCELSSSGDIERAIFPRSAVKAMQCLAMVDAGAADRFGLGDEELALACASHSGEPHHVEVARRMLAAAGNNEEMYECGGHWPASQAAAHDLISRREWPRSIHNNCSGKHAGMLALARALGVDPSGYVQPEHPVQRAIAATLSRLCGVDVATRVRGVDGCSVPTWALPLHSLAEGFARFCDPADRNAQRILAAVRAHPFLVGGSERFDTQLMQAVPRAFVKTGAEGVYCACIPHAGIGVALKIDDGASRASQLAIAAVLASLDVWTDDERTRLLALSRGALRNWRDVQVGERLAVIDRPDAGW